MKSKKEYKPILVFYLSRPLDSKSFNEIKEATGYNVISICTDTNERVEIISVDKATVVEDVRKYLKDQLIKSNNNGTI